MPDPTPYPSPLPGRWAAVVGALGATLAGLAPALPWPDAMVPVAVLGFLLASLGGLAVAPPPITEGRPLVQGTALAVATGGVAAVTQLYPGIPDGWPKSLALAGAAILAWASGSALPHLGATANVPPAGGAQ